MKIYSKNNALLYDIVPDDSSVRYRSIMNDDSLTLQFSLTEHIEVPLYSYVDFEGKRYTLWKPENFKKNDTRDFEYTLTLGGFREALKLWKFKNTAVKPYQLKFTLTAKPLDFLTLLVGVLNLHDTGWQVGGCVDMNPITLSFNHEYCIDVLNRLADECKTEYEFEGKKIHLRKVEYNRVSPLQLSYGKGNGFKSGVMRANDGDKQPIGRLYVQGGERNIDFSKYGSKTLLLPKSASLVYEGYTYVTDADGMYITRYGNNNTAEDSYDASHIYPHRRGEISEVVIVDAEKHFYDIKDSSIPETLNYRDCRIAGEKATIKFETGALAGREFDIEQTDADLTGYIHAERRFKIVPAELDGFVMPGGAFVPAVGDKYAIFNINLPQSYIRDDATKTGASWDMFRECVRYFRENEDAKFQFTGELDGVWSKSRWLQIGGKIIPGGYVAFSDPQFLTGSTLIRIISVKDYINNPHKPEITLSNAPVSGSFGGALAKLEADEVTIDDRHKEALQFSRRQWRDAKETMEMLAQAMLEGFTPGVNPITVQTMQLLVGGENSQFRFVNNKTSPIQVQHAWTYNQSTKVFTAPAGILQHMTVGISTLTPVHKPSEYRFWDMALYPSPPLTNPGKAYYLYARCAKVGSAGTFVLRETSIAMEGEAGYYHFLYGILSSEQDGVRSFATLYGFTEILPGRIVTDRIVSQDGETYWDLVNNIFQGKFTFKAGSSGLSNLSEFLDLSSYVSDVESVAYGAEDIANNAQNTADSAMYEAQSNVTDYNAKFAAIQQQVDGEISNWFYAYSPTLSNFPASEWTTNAIKDRHVGDTFTNTQQAPASDAGKSWRFMKNGTVYSWQQIADSDAVLALLKAAQAQSAADGKNTTYLAQPTKYAYGDSWVLASDITLNGTAYKAGDILTATNTSTYFVASHWVKKVRYTDDTALENLQIGGANLIEDSEILILEAGAEQYKYKELAKLKQNTTYVFAVDKIEKLAGTATQVRLLLYDLTAYVNGELKMLNFSNERQYFKFTTPSTYNYTLLIYVGEAGATAGNTVRFTQLLLQEGNKSTTWLAYDYLKKAIGQDAVHHGALMALVTILLKENMNAQVTAGVSGIQGTNGNHPAFWAGGTYEQALTNIAKTIFLHNGGGQLAGGSIIWDKDGNEFKIVSQDSSRQVLLTKKEIPAYDLISNYGNEIDTFIYDKWLDMNNPSDVGLFPTITAERTHEITLSHTTLANTSIFGGILISARNLYEFGTDQIQAYFEKFNGTSWTILYQGTPDISNDTYQQAYYTFSVNGQTLTAGKYRFRFTGMFGYSYVTNSPAHFRIEQVAELSYTYDIKRVYVGIDGIAVYDTNTKNFVRISSSESVIMRGRGDTDMPGVLLSGSVGMYGGFNQVWGAKKHASNTAIRNSVGYYTVYHAIGHTDYSVQITPETAQRTYYVATRQTGFFVVYFYNLSSALADANFNFQIVGKNWA